MSDFFTNFEAKLSSIHQNAGVTDDQVKADILAQVKPLTDSIAEIQTALNDLETKLASGDTSGAQAALETAQTAVTTVTAVPAADAAPATP